MILYVGGDIYEVFFCTHCLFFHAILTCVIGFLCLFFPISCAGMKFI